MKRFDVVVVGAGPVGLVCALKLSRAGVDVLLLEAESELNQELRASTFHPPTLDMLEEFGVTATVIRQGLITPTWQVRMHPSGERAEFDLSILREHTRHPYRVQCEQWKLSRMLVTQLTSELWFDTRALDVRQAGDAVTLLVERGGEREELECSYLIAADGARSAVRRALALGFEGVTFPETTILATTRFDFAAHLPGLSGVNYCWAPSGTFSLLRLPPSGASRSIRTMARKSKQRSSPRQSIASCSASSRFRRPTKCCRRGLIASTSASLITIALGACSSPAMRRTSIVRRGAWA